MSDHERSFAFYIDCINDLYIHVNQVLELNYEPEQVKNLTIAVKHAYTEMERAMLREEILTKFAESLVPSNRNTLSLMQRFSIGCQIKIFLEKK